MKFTEHHQTTHLKSNGICISLVGWGSTKGKTQVLNTLGKGQLGWHMVTEATLGAAPLLICFSQSPSAAFFHLPT